MKSATWTTVSFLAVTALGAAAFAGCTVTSGTIDDNDEGGTGLPANKDSGTGDVDSGIPPRPVPSAACPGNTKQPIVFIDATCQSALENACCAQLTSCFNIDPAATDAGDTSLDCAGYSTCIAQCTGQPDAAQCFDECDLAASGEVRSAYEAIVSCSQADPAAKAACGG